MRLLAASVGLKFPTSRLGRFSTSRQQLKHTNLEYIFCAFPSSTVPLSRLSRFRKMPIKWVLFWQANPGSTVNTQILSEVSQCVESVNGVKGGRWKASLTFYRANQRDPTLPVPLECPRDLMGILLQEQPNKYYFISRNQRLVVEADSTIQTIMEKLQSYRSRVSVNFEGVQYQLGDFHVRVGKVVPTNADTLRGIVMEMEYLPISSIDTSRQIMDEFLDMWTEIISKRSLPGHFMHIDPNYTEYGLSDQYSSQHTVVQYCTFMTQLLTVRN